MRILTVFLIILLSANVSAQIKLSDNEILSAIDVYREMLSIPNNGQIEDHVEKNVSWCVNQFSSRNFNCQILETDGPPLLLASYNESKPDRPTVLVYLQIDGQPVDPDHWWQEDPYTAVLKKQSHEGDWVAIPWDTLHNHLERDWRIFARSASDAKGPDAMFLSAMDYIHKNAIQIPYNLKVIMDFEEELGSPHLPAAVLQNRELLKADHLVIFDGPPHLSNQPTLSFGARGITKATLTTYGPDFPQHSGNYGNFVPNPIYAMSDILSTFKNNDGVVQVGGWYDGITIDEATRKILEAVPDDEKRMKYKMGFAQQEKVAPSFQEALQYPTLNVRGIQSGWVKEEARTIIPSMAVAEIDIRTVVECDPELLISSLKKHIEALGYTVLDRKPTQKEKLSIPKIVTFEYLTAYQAFRTELDSPTGLWLRKAMNKATGKDPILIRTMGGSIPISPFVNTLGVPAVTVPTVNPDNNQHSPNENLRLGNFIDGIGIITTVLTTDIK